MFDEALVGVGISEKDVIDARRRTFSVHLHLPDGLLVVRSCYLVGPRRNGSFSVYGPSRWTTSGPVELVTFAPNLRRRIRDRALEKFRLENDGS